MFHLTGQSLLYFLKSLSRVTGSVLEVSVRPGDNITLYCDCKKSTGVYIVWYRNCSHENQPPFILKTKDTRNLEIFPRFMFVENTSSNSFDLLIMNVTESDEGIYYCGTQHEKVEERDHIGSKTDYRFGNITTRIILSKYCGLIYLCTLNICNPLTKFIQ
uniref:Ig-like domain-containing protein n=1 Tax=Sparus aurata TaxID=8175 RepID=A0A671XFY7_SPAAU